MPRRSPVPTRRVVRRKEVLVLVRHLGRLVLACTFAFTAARCGGDSTSSGDGGVLPPVSDDGGTDGGTVDGGGSDGGTTDGGTSDGGTTDGGPPSASCTGLVPTSLGQTFTFTTPHSTGQTCFFARASRDGDIATDAHGGKAGDSFDWAINAAGDGQLRTTFDATAYVFGVDTGFDGLQRPRPGKPNEGRMLLTFFAHDGGSQVRTDLGGADCTAIAARDPNGGGTVLSRCASGVIVANRFGHDGSISAANQLQQRGQQPLAVGVDVDGNSLALFRGEDNGQAANTVVGQWLDIYAQPRGGTFLLAGVGEPERATLVLRPAIGGGLFLKAGSAFRLFVPAGVSAATPAPDWLTRLGDVELDMVEGRLAYAVLPATGGAVQVLTPQGQGCGTVTLPADRVVLGQEGSAIGFSGEGGCTHTVWRGLFR